MTQYNPKQKEALDKVLAKYKDGLVDGIFTDGGARPNPGPGGWGAVYVKNNEIIWAKNGYSEDTTNNRMEITALIETLKSLSPEDEVQIYSDSNLCVNTLNIWAKNWEKANWTKKSGPIKNLELVKEAYSLYNSLPKVNIKWVKAHNGWRWNEYADVLSGLWTLS